MTLIKERYQYRINSAQDRKRINLFCDKLQSLIEEKYGSFQVKNYFAPADRFAGRYAVYLKKNSNNLNETNIVLKLSFYYSNKRAHITKEDEDISNNDLEIILNPRSKLMFVSINYFSVNPKRTGVGTFIIKNIIRLLKDFPDLKLIALTPKDNNAKKFWECTGFVNNPKECIKYCKFTDLNLLSDMTYVLE